MTTQSNEDVTPGSANFDRIARIVEGLVFPRSISTQFGDVEGYGLTKRELFAVFSDQPGVVEIVTAAGLHCTDNFWVWKDAETKIGSFTDWWSKMSNEERFALSSKVRVQQADALLTALQESPK